MIREVFAHLNITDYIIKINHRGVLAGLTEVLKAKGKETDLYTAIDKLDKIGEQGVRTELLTKGFDDTSIDNLFSLLKTSGDNIQKTDSLNKIFKDSEQGSRGIADLKELLALLNQSGSNDDHVEIDAALARGLSYYTGTIFEVKINNVAIGSVSGGGRYDNLTQAFGVKEPLPGIGISFGVDRIFDAMEELNLFPKETQRSSRVLVCHLDRECMQSGLKVLSQLRNKDIAAEIYPDVSKLKKQLDYANKKGIPFVIVIGSEEMQSGVLVLKNMSEGKQQSLRLDEIINQLVSKTV
jgi:histidyl-tRNA synthetase